MANLQHYKLQEAWRILSLGICAHFNGEKHCGWANTMLQHTVQEAFCCNRFHIFFLLLVKTCHLIFCLVTWVPSLIPKKFHLFFFLTISTTYNSLFQQCSDIFRSLAEWTQVAELEKSFNFLPFAAQKAFLQQNPSELGRR